jgi:hypothetical protein
MNRRIRSFKPEFFADGKVCSLRVETRYMLLGLISIADDDGRFRAEAVTLASAIFLPELSRDPLECLAMVSRGLLAMASMGIIVLYESPGEKYGALVNWHRHQKIDKPTKSRLPRPPEPSADDSRGIREEFATDSAVPRGLPSTGSWIVDRGSGIEEPTNVGLPPSETPPTVAATPARPLPDSRPAEVYDFWVTTMGKSGVAMKKTTAAAKIRLAAVRARLSDGYTVDEIKAAVVACAKSEFHNGVNAQGHAFNDLTLICRADKIDRFLERRTPPIQANGTPAIRYFEPEIKQPHELMDPAEVERLYAEMEKVVE